jgi:N-sulfoglucosamine sulfohydrolase
MRTLRLVSIILFLVSIMTLSVDAADRPNILWFTAEDMSPTLGCWGDEYATTPNIDALCEESTRYTHAFATAPVCSPCRSCLITGCYATSLGTQRLRTEFPIPDFMTGFPTYLREVGYYCTNNVKTDYNTSDEPRIIRESWDESSDTAHWRNRPDKDAPFFCVFNDMTTHQSRTMVWPYQQFQNQVQSRLTEDLIHDPETVPLPPYYPDTPLVRQTQARYYDCVSVMDLNIAKILAELEEDGLAEDTIVFFYSDHGSGMPRHKRDLHDSGMHVPLLIRFPEKWRHLAPTAPGESTDRLVSFVDFAPTVLSLCDIELPDYMQGEPFLGKASEDVEPREYVYGARDRVDEVFDLSRSVRNGKYLYIRNFMPHLPWHQPSAWPDQGEFRDEFNRLSRAIQSGEMTEEDFTAPQWAYLAAPKPLEELYDCEADPMNLVNLAVDAPHYDAMNNDDYAEMWIMRKELFSWMQDYCDLGAIPESIAWSLLSEETPTPWDFQFNITEAYQLLNYTNHFDCMRIFFQPDHFGIHNSIATWKQCDDVERFWETALWREGDVSEEHAVQLFHAALNDDFPTIRIEAAGALARYEEHREEALAVLAKVISEDDGSQVDGANLLHATRTIELIYPDAVELEGDVCAMLDRLEGHRAANQFIQFSGEAFLKRIEERE